MANGTMANSAVKVEGVLILETYIIEVLGKQIGQDSLTGK
jgi:hypothetical protein